MFEEIRKGALAYTLADLLTWPATENWELIHGIGYKPVSESATLSSDILARVQKMAQSLLIAMTYPSSLVLPDEDDDIAAATNIVRPDLCLLSTAEKAQGDTTIGKGRLILEITSPETHVKDNVQKLGLYEKWQCPVYLIYDAATGNVLIHRLQEKKYSLPDEIIIAQSSAAEQLAHVIFKELHLTG